MCNLSLKCWHRDSAHYADLFAETFLLKPKKKKKDMCRHCSVSAAFITWDMFVLF